MRDLGDLGELFFNAWCSEVGLVANKSTKDKMGWDFLVEFPFNHDISGLKIHQSAPKCKIQVKATDGKKRKLAINLSNLRKLAVDPLPCFYIFIEFDKSNSPQRAFLRHLDEELIEKILEISCTKKHQTFTIHYDEHHQLTELTGSSLAKRIEYYIKGELSGYIFRKKNFLENVGYKEGRLKIKFNTIGKENIEELIDVHLGLKEKTKISNLSLIEKRFGISYEKLEFTAETVELSIPNLSPTAKSKIIFRHKSISNDYRFNVDVYFPPFIDSFDHPLFKSKFSSNFFDITMKNNTKKIDLTFNLENKLFTLQNLRYSLKFINDISSGKRFKLIIIGDNGQYLLGTIHSDKTQIDFTKNINTLESLIKITELFEINETVLVNLDDTIKLEGSAHNILELFQEKNNNLCISFNVKDGKLKNNSEIVLLGILPYHINETILYAFYSAEGGVVIDTDTDTEYTYVLSSPKLTILKKLSTNTASPFSIDELYDELDIYENMFNDRPVVIMKK